MNPAIWIALAAALVTCVFAACHTALKTFSRKRLASLWEDAGRSIDRLEGLDQRLPGLLLMTAAMRTLGSIVVLLASLAIVRPYLPDFDQTLLRYVVAAALGAAILLIVSVAIPLSWARYRQERLLAWALPPLDVLLKILAPLVWPLHLFDPVVRRISGVDLHDDARDISDDVLTVVEEHQSAASIGDDQKEMLEAVFDLPGTTAGEIMTPRTDMIGIEVGSPLATVKDMILEHGHSRIPVYEESLDQIVGILYVKDLIRFVGDGEQFNLRSVLREPFLVPESKSVADLLREFKQRKVHLAIVLDEYGGTSGLVTIEDILEEIVGEIQDEYEEQDEPELLTQVQEHVFEVDARMDVDDLSDELDLDMPEDGDYDTLGGFVFATLGHIPEAGEAFDHDGHRFTVTEAERTRVVKVRIEKLDEAEVESTPNGQAA